MLFLCFGCTTKSNSVSHIHSVLSRIDFLFVVRYYMGHMSMISTSWGNVAEWYKELLEQGKGTYQHDIMLPHLSRLLALKKGERVLDLGCGPGFFAREFAHQGAEVLGTDISPELIRIANSYREKQQTKGLSFGVASADKLPMVKNGTMDTVTIILAIQNIKNMAGVFAEAARALKPHGRMILVLNHPAFRVPKASDWGWDEEKGIQYRRIDAYLSEAKVGIQMHPGENPEEMTVSFHRSLQLYFKTLHKAGLAVTRLEEWESNRQGPKGRKFSASEKARKEIPLFLFLEARKYE